MVERSVAISGDQSAGKVAQASTVSLSHLHHSRAVTFLTKESEHVCEIITTECLNVAGGGDGLQGGVG